MTPARGHLDLFVGLGLGLASAGFLLALPRTLNLSDEGLYVYEALRVSQGAVLYRDLFELITPGGQFVLAVLFRIFGADLTTVRAADAVLHGLLVVAMYVAGRAVGARRTLAAGVALVHLVALRPAWPMASPHWVSTTIGLWIEVLLLRGGSAGWAGVLVGLVAAVQQQRGAVFLVGTGLALVAAHVVTGRRVDLGGLVRRLGWFAGGVAAVDVPLAVYLLVTVGPGPLWGALVRHPLVNYRGRAAGAPWGYVSPFNSGQLTFPHLLAAGIPLMALAGACLAAATLVRPRAMPDRRSAVVLAVLSVPWIGVTLYSPDFIHLAFVAGHFLLIALALAEVGLRLLARWSAPGRCMAVVAVTALWLAVAGQGARVYRVSWDDAPVRHATPFGVVQFNDRETIDALETVRARVRAAGSDELFLLPGAAGWLLLTGLRNATRYQFFVPGYNGPDQEAEVIAVLAEKRLPFVLAMPMPDNPVSRWVSEHYEPEDLVLPGPFPWRLMRARHPAGPSDRP